MSFDRDAVLATLKASVSGSLKFIPLADDLGVRKQDHHRLRKLLARMVAEHVLVAQKDAWGLPGGAAARETSVTRPPTALPWGRPASVDRGPPAPRPASARGKVVPSRTTARARGDGKAPAEEGAGAGTGTATAMGMEAKAGRVLGEAGSPYVAGRISVHPAGYGFVVLEDGDDVFVPAKYRGNSLDGDRVVLYTWDGYKGTEGRVEEVVARGRAKLTGTIESAGRSVWLLPDDPRIAADFGRVILEGGAPHDAVGHAVVAEIVRYPTEATRELAARVTRVLGAPDDPRTEIEKILACADIPREFPAEAAAQAEATPHEVGAADLADRIDLRLRPFVSIDPEDARDFDDAVCIEDGPHGGPRVWVAVADVSHYVRSGDPLDRESTIRGVSVYLPDRVIPMLPFALSSGICSLNPNVDRLAMVVRLDYRDDGTVVDTSFAAAVIRSHARLDYPGVAAALAGDFRGRREEYRPWAATLARLDRLAQTLRARRRARGALDLDLPEPKVLLDADDPLLVRDVVRQKANEDVKQAYELVEEFMIAANEAVGAYFRARGVGAVWRIHAPPLRARVEDLARVLAAYGIAIDPGLALTPLGMKAALDKITGASAQRTDGSPHPAARSLSFLILRSLKQAVWSTNPIGHFGLASTDYLHFTSPIRRYPDVLVHRLLKHQLHLEGQASGGGHSAAPPLREKLEELASASSAHERRAMEAEREAVSMYRAYLVRSQVGERFQATVSGVTSFGVFIEIDQPFIEGLIKLEALGNDFFEFDEVGMRLRGRRTGLTISLGDRVTVELINVSVPRRRIDFQLIAIDSAQEVGPAAPRSPSGRSRQGDAPRSPRATGRPAPRDRGGGGKPRPKVTRKRR